MRLGVKYRHKQTLRGPAQLLLHHITLFTAFNESDLCIDEQMAHFKGNFNVQHYVASKQTS